MEGKRYKGMFIYYEPKTQEEWTQTEWCNAYNLEQAKEIFKKRNPNLIWVCSEDNKEGWHIKEDNPDWKSQTERLYDINNKQVYESMSMKKQTIKLTESQLKEIVRNTLLEFRSDNPFNGGYDGDAHYVRPNGSTYFRNDDNFKTHFNNITINRGKRAYDRYGDSIFNKGKGTMCWNILKNLYQTLQIDMNNGKPNGKIEWTPEELKTVEEIAKQIRHLASLSKTEGMKKRGQMPQAAEE